MSSSVVYLSSGKRPIDNSIITGRAAIWEIYTETKKLKLHCVVQLVWFTGQSYSVVNQSGLINNQLFSVEDGLGLGKKKKNGLRSSRSRVQDKYITSGLSPK